MIAVTIPGLNELRLQHLVLDYNGTLAKDGVLLSGVVALIVELASQMEIHVITADTFGLAASQLAGLPVKLTIAPAELQAEVKLAYVNELGAERVIAVGNGRNDRKMLEAAVVGIALIQGEGCSAATLAAADVVCHDILDALALLTHPQRLVATLRS